MKKFMKKSSSLLMALALVLISLAPTSIAYAQTKGSITIKTSEEGMDYRLYKIFDLTYSGEVGEESKVENVAYTITDIWKEFFENGGAAYLENENHENGLNEILMPDGSLKYLNITEANIDEFAMDAFEYAAKKEPIMEVSGTGNELKIDVDSLGYYLVYPVGAGNTIGDQKSIVSLTSTTPDAEVDIKSEKPTIEKEADKGSCIVGETVDYTITGTVPNTTGFEKYIYRITDTLSEGLTLDRESIEVKIASPLTKDEDFNLDIISDQEFKISLDMTQFQKLVGEKIVVTYSATLNENAISGETGNCNDAILEYSNDPKNEDSTEKTPGEEVKVYTYDIDIIKTDGKDPGKLLAGAEFILKNQEGKYYHVSDSGDKVTWVDESEATIVITDENGKAKFKGLEKGTYILIETKAPEGYNILDVEQIVTIGEESNKNIEVEVKNNAGTELPGTGGMGTRIFTLIGGGLIVLAGYSLLKNKSGKKDLEE